MVLYQIDNIKKLIDLNGELVNFELVFKLNSKENAEYDAVVVDQTTLDSGELEYKKVRGSLAGKVVSDKNVYQNYFLILKSDKPCSVDVEIDIKEIPPSTQEVMEFENSIIEPQQETEKVGNIKQETANSNNNVKTILIVAGVLIIGYIGYKYLIGKKNSEGEFTEPMLTYSAPGKDLLAKLNSLDFD